MVAFKNTARDYDDFKNTLKFYLHRMQLSIGRVARINALTSLYEYLVFNVDFMHRSVELTNVVKNKLFEFIYKEGWDDGYYYIDGLGFGTDAF